MGTFLLNASSLAIKSLHEKKAVMILLQYSDLLAVVDVKHNLFSKLYFSSFFLPSWLKTEKPKKLAIS